VSSWYSNGSPLDEDLQESNRSSAREALLLFVLIAAALIAAALVVERISDAPVRSTAPARSDAPPLGLGR
jgi:hypothetical protein